MTASSGGRITFRGGYRARLYAGVLFATGGMLMLMFGCLAVLLAPELARGMWVAVLVLACGGLFHVLRPVTMVDLDARQVRWGAEVLRIDELRAVAFTSRVETIRGKGGPQKVEVFGTTLFRMDAPGRGRELMSSSDPRPSFELSRRLARTLRLPWIVSDGEGVREVGPEVLDQPMRFEHGASLSAAPKGVGVNLANGQTRIDLPGWSPVAVLGAAMLPAGMCGFAWFMIPAFAHVARLIVAGIGLIGVVASLSIPLWLLRAVVLDHSGLRLLRRRDEWANLSWGDLRFAQPSPLGKSMLIGYGDRLLRVGTPHAKWLCAAITSRLGLPGPPRAEEHPLSRKAGTTRLAWRCGRLTAFRSTIEAKDAEALFRLFSSLDAYVNSRLQLVNGCRTPAEIRSSDRASLHKIRGALWTNLDLLTTFIADNPFGLTASELAQVAAWKDAVVGQFYVERSLKAGTILVSASGPASVYSVAGITESIPEVLYRSCGEGQARLLTTTLVPFKGRIVYDGFLVITQASFGPGIGARYRDAYLRAKEQGAIIVSLPARPPNPDAATGKRASGASVELVTRAVEALGPGGSNLEQRAFAVLKRAASLALAAQRGEALEKDAKAVSRAMRRLEDKLERDKWGLD